MLDLTAINDTIEQLENDATSFSTCEKLAILYVVRDHISTNDAVKSELQDILPAYHEYCNTKRRYQLHEIQHDAVLATMELVCTEVDEFLRSLYRNTETDKERVRIRDTLSSVMDFMER